jgi:hypothetical protein
VRLAERDKEQREATAKAEETKVLASWAEKVTAIKQSVPDFAEKIDASPVQVAPYVRDAILDSEVGPRMLLHLAENKAEAEALGRMSAVRALKEIGKLEEKYLKGAPKAEPKAEPKAPEVEISKAPAPINPLKGASAPLEAPVNAQGEYVGTYAQWKALRKAGKIH